MSVASSDLLVSMSLSVIMWIG